MQIKYEILNFYPETAAVMVKYYTDEFPEGFTYNVDIPLDSGVYPEEIALNDIIMLYAPKFQIERITTAKNIEPPEYLKAYIKISTISDNVE